MTLQPGDRLGPYEVRSALGAGGMGEVYRARDTKLGRDVAIKILPSHFTSDPDRLARFEREARVLASLNHPHIGAIYGLEDADGVRALVLELVQGETLADRIARGPIPLNDALAIARQIVDALDAAHERGIVHRDLKPANIKITPDHKAKVLDFGLAKAVASGDATADLTQSPTMTAGTCAGVILGTAAYMSPEQARGLTVDKRTDIWAFGCVLYEMLSRRAAFARDTVTDTLAAIVEREPDWIVLPPSTPQSVQKLLARCLQKDPKQRLRDIADAHTQLDVDSDSTRVVGPSRRRFGTLSWVAALATVVGLAAFVAATSILRPRAVLPPWATDATAVSIDIPASTTLQQSPPAVSPDGRQVAWAASSSDGRTRIWTQTLATGIPRELEGAEGVNPFWSPDGRSIGFLAQGQLKRIEVSTGTVRLIAAVPTVSSGATWSAEDIVVFAARYGIFSVPVAGGTPTKVADLNRDKQENQLLFPQFLPDNRHFLYVARSGRPQHSGAYVGSLDGKPIRLFSTTSFVRYAPPGYLLSVRDGALVAQPFNPATLAIGTEATTIVRQIRAQGSLNGRFDVSPNGLLAFFGQRTDTRELLRWFDRSGNSLGDLTETADYENFRIAPDGQRVVVDRSGDDNVTGGRSVWIYEADGRPPNRITFGGIDEWHPLWSPDAQSLAFMSYRDGPGDIYVKSLSAAAPEEPLIADKDQKVPADWSADGRFLAYHTDGTDSRTDVWVLPVAPKGAPIPVARTPFEERRPRFSPDGRFIAYESDETGQPEVFVQPFPPTGRKWQVSVNGGMEPKWRDRELLFTDRDRMITTVPVTTSGSIFSPGRGVPLFKIATRGVATGFEVSPDGRRVLVRMVTPVTPQPMMLLLNWMARLNK